MVNKFKILIVDDEVLMAEFLKDLLIGLNYSQLELAHNKRRAIERIEDFKPNLILLDIRMNDEIEGIELAEIINEQYKMPFIYITAHSDKETIQRALNTKPLGYITKPFKQADVYATIKIAEESFKSKQEEFLVFKDGYIHTKLPINDILFVEASDNYIDIHSNNKKYTLRNTLEWFKENTPDYLFHRTHRSYIVNITKITKSSRKSVFINNIEIPVSRGNQPKI
jgi:two-component system response regulator LytT